MGKWKSGLAMTQRWLLWFEWINLFLGSLYRPHSKQMNYWYLGDKYHSKGKAVIDFSRQKERMKTMERELRKWRVHSLSQNPSPPFCLAFFFCFPCICLSLPVSDCLTGRGRKWTFTGVISFMSRFPWKGWGTTVVSDELHALKTGFGASWLYPEFT